LSEFMPEEIKPDQLTSYFFFGGLYQKVVLQL
jgi:hypothetical protein